MTKKEYLDVEKNISKQTEKVKKDGKRKVGRM